MGDRRNRRATCAPRPTDTAVSHAEPADLTRLRSEPLEVLGRFGAASNATLLCRLGEDGPDEPIDVDASGALRIVPGAGPHLVVYKPQAGEAPLWDFPSGTLYRREVAAYEVGQALGWRIVPATVARDGPHGVGSVQRYVEHDPRRHYFSLIEGAEPQLVSQLRRMVVFDLLVNNADRKAGHVLVDDRGHVWLVDHGVTFHEEPKLRTVAWEFAGEPMPQDLRSSVGALASCLADAADATHRRLLELLSGAEVRALADRAVRIAALERFPGPIGPRPYPWPLL